MEALIDVHFRCNWGQFFMCYFTIHRRLLTENASTPQYNFHWAWNFLFYTSATWKEFPRFETDNIYWYVLVTARVQSKTGGYNRPHPKDGGRYCFQFVSSHLGKGGGMGWPTFHLMGECLPSSRGGDLPKVGTLLSCPCPFLGNRVPGLWFQVLSRGAVLFTRTRQG